MTNQDRTLGARESSVQTRANDETLYNVGLSDALAYYGLSGTMQRLTDVPLYGTNYIERAKRLRNLWTLAGSEPAQAAISVFIQKVQSTPWVLEGPSRIARRYHSLLHNADFGQGWEEFLARSVIDYLTQDNGVFWEIIYEDNEENSDNPPLAGADILGIAHLDSARCIRTGNVEYPVVYRDMKGVLHRMHATRIMFAADMPSPVEQRYGMGFCALSRCIAAVQTVINWSEMRNEFIDDMPPLGILTLSHMNKQMFIEQYNQYQKERESKEQQLYRGLLMLFNPSQEIKVDFTTFRQTWDGFKEKDMYDICIDLTAMAFGLDRMELAPMAGHTLGAGSQAGVLNQKSRGKGVSNVLNLFERFLNRITPPALTFRFEFQDDEADRTQAEIQAVRARTILALYTATPVQSSMTVENVPMGNGGVTKQQGLISKDEARYLLVKQGVLPREILTAEENLNPDWERFDDVTVKALRRYGEIVLLEKDGTMRRPEKPYHPPPNVVLHFPEAKSA